MTRELEPSVSGLLEDDVVYPFFAVELLFDGNNVLRMWTGLGDIVIDGVTYFGSGNLLGISEIEETSEIAAKGATIDLTGVPSEVLSLALQEPYQGRICNIYLGLFSVNNFLLAESGDYILTESGDKIALEKQDTSLTEIFTGYMDQMNVQEDPNGSVVELKVENKLIDLERQRVARYTSAYQKSQFPGDKGLDFVSSLQDKSIVWGRRG